MMDVEFESALSKSKSNSNAWMLTFADLLSLILTFFVMLYAIQQVEKQRWEHLIDSLAERLNPNRAQLETKPVKKAQSQEVEPIAINLDYLQAVLTDKFSDIPELAKNRIRRFDDRLVISFSNEEMFNGGGFTLSENAKYELGKFAIVLGNVGNRIEVAGYASQDTKIPEKNPWRYTMQRASAVADEIKRAGYMYSVGAFGLGYSRALDLKSQSAKNASLPDPDRIELIVREMTPAQ